MPAFNLAAATTIPCGISRTTIPSHQQLNVQRGQSAEVRSQHYAAATMAAISELVAASWEPCVAFFMSISFLKLPLTFLTGVLHA